MKSFFDDAASAFICIFGVALTWVLFFKLNMIFFSHFESSKFINWVFIPAGIRLIAVLLFGFYGVIGLFIGAMMTSHYVGIGFDTAMMVSLISGINPYLSITVTKYYLKVDELMQGLDAKQLVTLSFFAALFNGISHNLYFHFYMGKGSIADCIDMFIGDLIGSLIVLFSFSLLIKWLRNSIKPQTQP